MITDTKKISDRILSHEFKSLKFGSFVNGGKDVYDAFAVNKFLNEMGYSVQDLEDDLETTAEKLKTASAHRPLNITMEDDEETDTDNLSDMKDQLKRQKAQYDRKEKTLWMLMEDAQQKADYIIQEAEQEAKEALDKAKRQVVEMLEEASNKKDGMLAEAENEKQTAQEQTQQLFEARKEVEGDIENYAYTLREISDSMLERMVRKTSNQ